LNRRELIWTSLFIGTFAFVFVGLSIFVFLKNTEDRELVDIRAATIIKITRRAEQNNPASAPHPWYADVRLSSGEIVNLKFMAMPRVGTEACVATYLTRSKRIVHQVVTEGPLPSEQASACTPTNNALHSQTTPVIILAFARMPPYASFKLA
jgi:hypothetical protein